MPWGIKKLFGKHNRGIAQKLYDYDSSRNVHIMRIKRVKCDILRVLFYLKPGLRSS